MLHRAQELRIDSRQPRQGSRIEAIIFSPALDDQAHPLGVRHDHFVPQPRQQSAHPRRMRSRLHRYATPHHPSKGLLHFFRGCWYLLFSKDFADFIQNAVRTETISQIQPNGELPVQNVFFTRLHSANLLHCRSPFLCALSTSIIGSLSHPVETGLLIPSDKRLPEKCNQAVSGPAALVGIRNVGREGIRTPFLIPTSAAGPLTA